MSKKSACGIKNQAHIFYYSGIAPLSGTITHSAFVTGEHGAALVTRHNAIVPTKAVYKGSFVDVSYQLGMLTNRSSVRLLYAKIKKQTVEVAAYEKYTLTHPLDLAQPDTVSLVQGFVDSFMQKYKIRKRKITLLLQADSLIVHMLSVSYHSQKDMEKKMNASLASFFPFPLSDYAVDYRFLSSPSAKLILIFGLPTTYVQLYLGLCTALRMKPLRFDVLLNALLTLFAEDTGTRIVVDISTEQACILFLRDGLFLRYQLQQLAGGPTDEWDDLLNAVVEGLQLVKKTAAEDFIATEVTLLGCDEADSKLPMLLAKRLSLPVRTSYTPAWFICPQKEIESTACLLAAALR